MLENFNYTVKISNMLQKKCICELEVVKLVRIFFFTKPFDNELHFVDTLIISYRKEYVCDSY